MAKGVTGDKEIAKALKKLGKTASDVLESAATAGAEVIWDEAERQVPKRTGNLADNIKVETLRKEKDEVVVGVGPDDEEAWYGFLVEFGTEQHAIERQTARGLEVDEGQFAASADHQGARGQPFMRPALDKKKGQANDAIAEVFKDALKL
jgi:HK97 gp10 family phage protein